MEIQEEEMQGNFQESHQDNDCIIIEEELENFQKEIQIEQSSEQKQKQKSELRRIPVPPHRMTPLKSNWDKIVTTIVENMKLQIRMNLKKKCVEIKSSEKTLDKISVQRGADFLKAFMLGFDINDAIALLRLDDLYIESFEIKDVKTLHGDHLSRCIGRISGEKGKTKNAIENATRSRIVLADQKIHIMASFQNIKIARDAVCSLILGSPPGKVYSNLRYISKRNAEKF